MLSGGVQALPTTHLHTVDRNKGTTRGDTVVVYYGVPNISSLDCQFPQFMQPMLPPPSRQLRQIDGAPARRASKLRHRSQRTEGSPDPLEDYPEPV